MAVDATSNSAVIAGRSQTSTRPVFSCRVSSASNLGHSEAGAWEAGGDTGPAARRCSHARCRHPEPHQRGTRPRAATTTSPPHHPHATTSGRQGASPRMPPSIPGTSHLPCQRLPRNRHTSCTPVPALCGRNVRTKPEGVSMDVESCPRCGRPVHWSERGRRARWCSQACRRAAYEERRAAATGAIAVRVVQRETTREPSPAECVTRVLGYPRACREVLNGLTTLAGQRTTGHRSPHRHPHRPGTTRAHPHRRRHLVTAMPRAAPPMSTVGVGYTHDGHPHPDTYRVQSG
jgi:endogenous inhibitor of DNA gyrase (YacG/DUF329 family)